LPRTDEGALAAVRNQLKEFKDILGAAYGLPPVDDIMDKGVYIYDYVVGESTDVKRTHRSKSIELPIVGACVLQDPQNVTVENLSDNFHFYFLSLKLKQAIPATLLWPLSGLFGSVPLSGHVTDRNFVTNFPKAYHNVERLSEISMSVGNGLQAALVIRYLNEVSKLPVDDILNRVLYKTRYGTVDAIDFNAVDSNQDLMKLIGLNPGSGYCSYDVENVDPLYEKLHVSIFDSSNGGSSLQVTMKGYLPPINLPSGKLHVKVTPEQHAVGIGDTGYGKEAYIPVRFLKRLPHETLRDLYPLRRQLHSAYNRVPVDNKEWLINTPNGLDTMLMAFMLNHCLPPVLQSINEAQLQKETHVN
jgi:hypothetical protein